MFEMFETKMCAYCKNTECDKNFDKKITCSEKGNIKIYKCNTFIKDSEKIIPYQKPLLVTTKRDYVRLKEF